MTRERISACEECPVKTAYVYIMANHTRTMYTGVTTDLERRVWEHKHADNAESYTAKHKLHKLVFFAEFQSITDAIAFEKYVKGKKRAWKMGLIEERNPRWNDLAWNWFQAEIGSG
jgi:putative endonuclease